MRRGLLIATVLVIATTMHGETQTITVDIGTKTVNPDNPTVNIVAAESVLVRLLHNGQHLPADAEIKSYLAGPSPLKSTKSGYEYQTDLPYVEGALPFVALRMCSDKIKARHLVTVAGSNQPVEPRCPFYTVDDSRRGWTVNIYEGVLLIRTVANWKTKVGEGEKATTIEHHEEFAFAVQVAARKYKLGWSAGFAFPLLRDHEYQLDTITSNTTEKTLRRISDGQVPYQLAAFAHYTRLGDRAKATSASFGLATKVPVNELTAMLGVTFSARTIPFADAGHFTVGVAYGPRKELVSEFRGRTTVPAATPLSTLTASRYGFAPFLAITFSFLGGETQFRGVYSGDAPKKDK